MGWIMSEFDKSSRWQMEHFLELAEYWAMFVKHEIKQLCEERSEFGVYAVCMVYSLGGLG